MKILRGEIQEPKKNNRMISYQSASKVEQLPIIDNAQGRKLYDLQHYPIVQEVHGTKNLQSSPDVSQR